MNTQHKGLGNTVFDVSHAFHEGYENWYNPNNLYPFGSIEYIDYELGVKTALDEQY